MAGSLRSEGRELNFVVAAQCDGMTVQRFLQDKCGVSTRLLRSLKRREHGMTADGLHIRSIDTLRAGQTVVLRLPPDEIRVEAVELPLSVVYEDEDVLVVDKPPYLAVHPQGDNYPDPTLAAAVVAYHRRKGEPLAFRPAGRLDRNTSGLLLSAKNAHASHFLNSRTEKSYIAVVLGRLEGHGVIDRPIRVREGFGITRDVGEGGKPSITRWESLSAGATLSAIRLTLDTGRTHQIRVHMAWLGHPLAGDTMYGEPNADRLIGRHALHCAEMWFPHPSRDEEIRLSSPVPEDMARLYYNSSGNIISTK